MKDFSLKIEETKTIKDPIEASRKTRNLLQEGFEIIRQCRETCSWK